jgi:hypothetical protein
LTPVTVSLPARREVASFEDFAGRLAAIWPGGLAAAALPRKPIAVRFDMNERSWLRYERLLGAGTGSLWSRPQSFIAAHNYPRILSRAQKNLHLLSGPRAVIL